jgi:hypothetical protein
MIHVSLDRFIFFPYLCKTWNTSFLKGSTTRRPRVFNTTHQGPRENGNRHRNIAKRGPQHMNKDYGEMTGCNNFCSFTNQGVVAARVVRGYEQPHIDVPPIYSLNTRGVQEEKDSSYEASRRGLPEMQKRRLPSMRLSKVAADLETTRS